MGGEGREDSRKGLISDVWNRRLSDPGRPDAVKGTDSLMSFPHSLNLTLRQESAKL